MTRYADRREAGRALAHEVRRFAGRDAVVLALPRGGVPVGFEIARELNVPLDVFVVRKLGVPRYEELAMGAIASGGVRVLNEDVIRRLKIPQSAIDEVASDEQNELERRERQYRGDLPPTEVRGKTVILVDDGLATGATMRAAVQALRQTEAARLVVAVPVGARDSVVAMREVADEVVCPLQPEEFMAVGAWYEDFSQTTDEEVQELLEQGNMTHENR